MSEEDHVIDQTLWSFITERLETLPVRVKGGKFKNGKGLDKTIWPEFLGSFT